MSKASKTIVCVLALAILAGGFFYYKTYIYEEQNISKWKTYQDERYNFEIKYPPHWEPAISNGYLNLFADKRFGNLQTNHKKAVKLTFGVWEFDKTTKSLRDRNFITKDIKDISLRDFLSGVEKSFHSRLSFSPVTRYDLRLTNSNIEAIREEHFGSDPESKLPTDNVFIRTPDNYVLQFSFSRPADNSNLPDPTIMKMFSTFRTVE